MPGEGNQIKIEASITGDNLKTFIRLLQCASKYGDDLHINVTKTAWEMSVTNSSKSAFCLFKLDKKFFLDRSRWDDRALRKGVKCRLLVKSMLVILNKVSQVNNVNRLDLILRDASDELHTTTKRKSTHGYTTDESSQRRYGEEDEYEDEDDVHASLTATLMVKLICKHGVIKKHSLYLGSSDFLRADVDPNSTPSGFQIATRTLRDWLEHFSIVTGNSGARDNALGGSSPRGLQELGWMFRQNEVRVKSWQGGPSGLTTTIKVDVEEFEEYEVMGERVDLTLPMQEFKATLILAEQLNITLKIAFSEATQPLTLTSFAEEFPECSIFCAIATTTCDAFADVDLAPVDIKRSRSITAAASAAGASPAPTAEGSRKKRPSEAPASARKRSSLNLSAEPEGMATIIRSNPAPNRSFVKDSMSRDTTHQSSQSAGPSRPRQEDQEPLFLSLSQPDEDAEMEDGHPPQSQKMRMTQQDVLDQAGLGDMDDLDDALLAAEDEDERQMEEEAVALSASQQRQVEAENNAPMQAGPSVSPSKRSPTRWATDNEDELEGDETEITLQWNDEIDQVAHGSHAPAERAIHEGARPQFPAKSAVRPSKSPQKQTHKATSEMDWGGDGEGNKEDDPTDDTPFSFSSSNAHEFEASQAEAQKTPTAGRKFVPLFDA